MKDLLGLKSIIKIMVQPTVIRAVLVLLMAVVLVQSYCDKESKRVKTLIISQIFDSESKSIHSAPPQTIAA